MREDARKAKQTVSEKKFECQEGFFMKPKSPREERIKTPPRSAIARTSNSYDSKPSHFSTSSPASTTIRPHRCLPGPFKPLFGGILADPVRLLPTLFGAAGAGAGAFGDGATEAGALAGAGAGALLPPLPFEPLSVSSLAQRVISE